MLVLGSVDVVWFDWSIVSQRAKDEKKNCAPFLSPFTGGKKSQYARRFGVLAMARRSNSKGSVPTQRA
jgi:hypothetical protein